MLPTDLPPLALIALGVTLAIIFAINRFGFMQGKTVAPAASAGAAQVAAVIVDPTALNHATAAVEGLTMAVIESNVIAREHAKATDGLVKGVEDLTDRVDRLTDKVVDAAARIK